MCEATSLATAPALISLPIPRPGQAVSLAMTVQVPRAATHEGVDEAMRRAGAHEAADQEGRAVGDQRRGRVGGYRVFHVPPLPIAVR